MEDTITRWKGVFHIVGGNGPVAFIDSTNWRFIIDEYDIPLVLGDPDEDMDDVWVLATHLKAPHPWGPGEPPMNEILGDVGTFYGDVSPGMDLPRKNIVVPDLHGGHNDTMTLEFAALNAAGFRIGTEMTLTLNHSVLPAPGSLALLGVAGFAARRRRRR